MDLVLRDITKKMTGPPITWKLAPHFANLPNNRLFPGRRAAATWRTCPRHSRSPPTGGRLWISLGASLLPVSIGGKRPLWNAKSKDIRSIINTPILQYP
jgi:hypothetical protein